MTTLEMLDLLEAGLAGLHLESGVVPVATPADGAEPEALGAALQASGLTIHEVAESLGVSATTLEDWLAGRAVVPALAVTAIQLLGRVAFSERRKLQKNGVPRLVSDGREVREPATKESVLRHPFSRIEEL